MASSVSFQSPDFNATVPCIIANCTGLCIYDFCSDAPPPSDNSSTRIHLRRHNHLLPTLLIAAASLLASSFFLFLTLYFFLHFRRRRRLRAHQNPPPHNPNGSDAGDLFEEEERDHHVWHIRTVGLEESTIKSIAAWVYKAGDGLVDGSDCSVCLGEFRDGELVRLLPKCSHAFHLPCIDTWLRSHVNCPLCRAPILSPAAADAADPASDSPVAAVDQVDPESGSSSLVEATQIGIQLPEIDLRVSEEENKNGILETGIGIGIGIMIDSLAGSSSELLAELGEDGLQPVRRSVSMDSSSLAALLLRGETEERPSEGRKEPVFQERRVGKNRGKQGNVSKGASLQKGPLDMERSLSSMSGRFFSRYGRAQNSVLPL